MGPAAQHTAKLVEELADAHRNEAVLQLKLHDLQSSLSPTDTPGRAAESRESTVTTPPFHAKAVSAWAASSVAAAPEARLQTPSLGSPVSSPPSPQSPRGGSKCVLMGMGRGVGASGAPRDLCPNSELRFQRVWVNHGLVAAVC